MSPHYWGEHWKIGCPDCSFLFECDLALPRSGTVVCPNCGCRDISVEGAIRQPAIQYQIEPIQDPLLRRWEVVALKPPLGEPGVGTIKRVVGLPGESISFAGGNLLVDGRTIPLRWADFDRLKILVFDATYDPRSIPGQRLRFEPAEAWVREADGWSVTSPLEPGVVPAITYHHWRCFLHRGSRDEIGPVEDVYPFDQALSRAVNHVDDLSLVVHVWVDKQSEFAIDRTYLGRNLQIVFSWCRKSVEIIDQTGIDQPVIIASFPLEPDEWDMLQQIELATVEERIAIRIGNSELGRIRIERGTENQGPPRFRLTVKPGGKVRIDRWKIFRDIFWFNQGQATFGDGQDRTVFRVPEGHYFLLGDNVPISKDSRDWENPFVPRDQVLGKVPMPR